MNQELNQTKLNLQEDQEKEARRNNTIIYRIPESDANSSQERKVTDNRFVLNLLTKMQVGVYQDDIRGSF